MLIGIPKKVKSFFSGQGVLNVPLLQITALSLHRGTFLDLWGVLTALEDKATRKSMIKAGAALIVKL